LAAGEIPVQSAWDAYREAIHSRTESLAWKFVMVVPAIAYLAVAIIDDQRPTPALTYALLGFSGLFLCEFAIRVWAADHRVRFIRDNWTDLLACVPFVGALRALTFLRFISMIAKTGMALRVMGVGGSFFETKWKKTLDSPSFVLGVGIVVWLLAAYGIWQAEHQVNPAVHTYSEALFWTILTMATLGNGSTVHLRTTFGSVEQGLLVFIALGIITLISSRLTACWFHQRDASKDLADLVRASEKEQTDQIESLADNVRELGTSEIGKLMTEIHGLRQELRTAMKALGVSTLS
jgi:voltage-gated potassium channel